MAFIKNGKIFIDYRFFVIFGVILFKYIKLRNEISDNITYIILMLIVLISFRTIYKKNKIKGINDKWFIGIMIMSISLLLIVNDINLLFSFLIAVLFIEDQDAIKHIIKYFTVSLVIIFIITAILGNLGILESAKIGRRINGEVVQRKSFGFSHPNEAFLYFLIITLGFYYLSKNTKTFLIMSLVSTIIIYNNTLSRTGLISVILLYILIISGRILKNREWIKHLFFICTVATFLIAIIFGDKGSEINIMLSGRPYYWNYYIDSRLIINLFGQKLVSGMIVDNMYLSIILSTGIIPYLFYLVIFYCSGKCCTKDQKLADIYTIILIYGMFETHTINAGINFLMIIQILLLIWKNNNLINEESKEDTTLYEEMENLYNEKN